jgi:hypothetical protein
MSEGAEGLDLGVDGAVDGAAEAAAEGAAEAAAEAVGGPAHGFEIDGAEGAGSDSFGALSALGLRKVPLTVALTTILLVAWVTCLLSMRYAGFASSGPVLTYVIGPVIFLGALIVATLVAAVLVRPLAPIFETHPAKTRADYVGSICEITTGRVDNDFGQAKIVAGGDVLVVPVRCDTDDNELGRGTRALIIDHDDARQAYLVEPYENVLGEKRGS